MTNQKSGSRLTDSQNLRKSQIESIQRQASSTNQPIKALRQEMLLVSKGRGQSSSKTFKPEASSVLAQVKDFLPRLAEANQILKEKVENGEGDAIDIETIEDSVESVIQMDLALVEQGDTNGEDSDSSEDSGDESIQGEITEENIKLTPGQKHKPVIELINTQNDSEMHSESELAESIHEVG